MIPCVGGLIALETAQYLQKKNVQVSDVTLISSNIPKQKNQTILSQATDEIYRKTLQSSLDNEILLERIFAKLIGADAYKAGYQVDEERLNKLILDGGQFESMGIMKKIDAYFMAKEFQKVIQKKRMWSYVSKQMGYRNGNEIEVLYPLCCKRIQFDTLYDAALAAYGYDIKKRMEKLRMKVVIMYGGNELFAAKSVSLVKEKCVSECEVYAYDNMGHSEVLSLHPEKLCEIIRK